DTILSARTIRAGGGSIRELHQIERASHSLVRAAITRARWAGLLRGLAATASGLATATAIAIGLAAHLPSSQIAAALAVVGFLATPLTEPGHGAEYRQPSRAARRVIGPAIEREGSEGRPRRPWRQTPGRRGHPRTKWIAATVSSPQRSSRGSSTPAGAACPP